MIVASAPSLATAPTEIAAPSRSARALTLRPGSPWHRPLARGPVGWDEGGGAWEVESDCSVTKSESCRDFELSERRLGANFGLSLHMP
jgi:hypothetical protein